MLNQLNTTTKRELDNKYLASADLNSEQVVGRLGDATLYQKTINCGALPNATTKYVSTDIVASQIVKIEGIATAPQSGGTDKAIAIPMPFTGSSGTYVGLYAHILATDKISIRISTDADRSAYSGLVTIQYTKPTQP